MRFFISQQKCSKSALNVICRIAFHFSANFFPRIIEYFVYQGFAETIFLVSDFPHQHTLYHLYSSFVLQNISHLLSKFIQRQILLNQPHIELSVLLSPSLLQKSKFELNPSNNFQIIFEFQTIQFGCPRFQQISGNHNRLTCRYKVLFYVSCLRKLLIQSYYDF